MPLQSAEGKASDHKKELRLGPDCDDIRTARPYFLVPLLVRDPDCGEPSVSDRIKTYVDAVGKPVTDIFVFSHGWHRNLFSGVAAYDRLVSRFAVLLTRGIIDPKGSFNPLFLAMHWNSDPDPDGWVDTAGRHDRNDFITRMNDQFEPMSPGGYVDVINLFNEIYDLFTYVSAPDTSLLDHDKKAKAKELFDRLNTDTVVRESRQTVPRATPTRADAIAKTSLAWRCYDESTPMQMLYRQTTPPQPFNTPWQAIVNLLRFAVAALAAAGLLAGLIPKVGTLLSKNATKFAKWTWGAIGHIPYVHPILSWLGRTIDDVCKSTKYVLHHDIHIPSVVATWMSIYFWSTAGSLALFWLVTVICRSRRDEKTTGVPILRSILFVVAQVCTLIPVLLLLLSTVFFRTWLVLLAPFLGWWISPKVGWWFAGLCLVWAFIATSLKLPAAGLFAERPGSPLTARDGLAAFARLPFALLKESLAPDSRLYGFADSLDRQLAFFEMQRHGVKAGVEAGDFMVDLHHNVDKVQGARIHLVGHSFGALLVSNLARRMAAKRGLVDADEPVDAASPGIHSLCIISAAEGSDWFTNEPWIMNRHFIGGMVGCVHSAYDTATGSIYPLANSSRRAAGSVGLFNPGGQPAIPVGGIPALASVSRPDDVPLPTGPGPHAVNIDASRFIYNGAIASGGGHDDVFKDDVVNVIWAVTSADFPAPGLIRETDPILAGRLNAYSVRPESGGPFPGIVMIHEINGLTDNIRRIADRLAAEGYAVLAVDLFTKRPGLPICLLTYVYDQWKRPFDNPNLSDLKAALGYLSQQEYVIKDRLGAVGFCFGGGYSISWGIADSSLKVIAPFYGLNPTGIDKVQRCCPVVGGYPEVDTLQGTQKDGRKLKVILNQLQISNEIDFYPNADHSFWNARPNLDAQEDSWKRLTEFLGAHI